MTTAFIGQPVSRVDGRQKVTGTAPYAAEFDVPMAHGAPCKHGSQRRITTIDQRNFGKRAGRLPSAHATLRGSTIGRQGPVDPMSAKAARAQGRRVSTRDAIALVIAADARKAHHAASLVRIRLRGEAAITDGARAKPVSRRAADDQGGGAAGDAARRPRRGACGADVKETSPTSSRASTTTRSSYTPPSRLGRRGLTLGTSRSLCTTEEEIAASLHSARERPRHSPSSRSVWSSVRTWPLGAGGVGHAWRNGRSS